MHYIFSIKNRTTVLFFSFTRSILFKKFSGIFVVELHNFDFQQIFLDLSKLFAILNHKMLLLILSSYALGNFSIYLLHKYLLRHSPLVSYAESRSKTIKVTSGAPQECILGYLLFSIYKVCDYIKYFKGYLYV